MQAQATPHNAPMQEIELKFQIPPDRVEAVRSAVAQAAANIAPLGLQAAYFDTPESLLAQHRMALRVRREGPDWVQTFKAAGRDAMTRVEDNQPARAPLDGRLKPDLSLHTAPAVRQALGRAFGMPDIGASTAADLNLQAVYETRFDRWTSRQAHPLGQVIVCVDLGSVVAGDLSEPLNELEIELADGQAVAVIDTARQWVDQHGVWLDIQSKAYRGTRLAQAARTGQPAPAAPVSHALADTLADDGRLQLRKTLSAAVDAAAGNWSEVAAARPGWPQALTAWHDTLAHLLVLAEQHTSLREALTDTTWQATQTLLDELARLQARVTELTTDAELQAQRLARAPGTTHWGLDLLTALRR